MALSEGQRYIGPKIEDESFESTRSPDTTGDSLCSVSVFNSGAENLE